MTIKLYICVVYIMFNLWFGGQYQICLSERTQAEVKLQLGVKVELQVFF